MRLDAVEEKTDGTGWYWDENVWDWMLENIRRMELNDTDLAKYGIECYWKEDEWDWIELRQRIGFNRKELWNVRKGRYLILYIWFCLSEWNVTIKNN